LPRSRDLPHDGGALSRAPAEPSREATLLGALAAAAIVALAIATFVQTGVWRDSIALFTQAARATPNNPIAQNMVGEELKRAGRWAEAVPYFRRAVALLPEYPDLEYPDPACNLGSALVAIGQYDETIALSKQALGRWPERALLHANLGLALLKKARAADRSANASGSAGASAAGAAGPGLDASRPDAGRLDALRAEGIEHLRQALRIDPAFVDGHLDLGVALADTGRYEDAIAQFSEVLRLRPSGPDAKRFLELARAKARLQGSN